MSQVTSQADTNDETIRAVPLGPRIRKGAVRIIIMLAPISA